MTLNEAIEHLDETLGDSSRMWSCEECRQEHIQLREWLIELKGLREAQEPHVMTLEEYDAWTDLPFTERDPVFHEERTERGTVTCWVNTTVCSLREYGKNDRCWTSKPTDAQRKATSWNR